MDGVVLTRVCVCVSVSVATMYWAGYWVSAAPCLAEGGGSALLTPVAV